MEKRVKTGGRKAGTPNKITKQLREAILTAFDEAGGVEYLQKVAEDQPSVFCQLLGKVLPMSVSGEDGGPLVITWDKS
jgi:hypothetical protein